MQLVGRIVLSLTRFVGRSCVVSNAGRWQQGELALPMEEWQCAATAEAAHHAAQAAKRSPHLTCH